MVTSTWRTVLEPLAKEHMKHFKLKSWGDLRTWIWREHYQFQKSSKSARSILDNLPIPVGLSLGMVDRPYLRTVLSQLREQGHSGATIRRYFGVLMKALREAHKDGYIDSVPAVPELPKAAEGRLRWLTREEETRLVSACSDYYGLITFLVDTGLRLGEALALEWSDVNFHQPEPSVLVRESKNGKPRTVPLTRRARGILAIPPREGRPIRPFSDIKTWSFHRAWNRAKKAMGLENDAEFVPHALRHTFASRLVQRGAGLEVVKKLLGHKRIENTMIYAHLAPEQTRAAIDLLEN